MTSNSSKTSGNQPALSVIVPVYNVEPWLARCLDSLVNQTSKDLEIIVVDDKSTDGSLNIIREYEKKDSRIQAVTLAKNGGLADARNAGLAVATGGYIGFVDSDDFLDVDFCEKLCVRARETGADIVKGETLETTYDGKQKRYGPRFAAIRRNKAAFASTLWSAIYRHDFLVKNSLIFPVGIISSEDDIFLLKAVMLANVIELVEGTYYHYMRREDSLESRMLSLRKIKSKLEVEMLIADFINEHVADDRKTYNLIFQSRFRQMIYSLYVRSDKIDGKLMVISKSIELYKKCIYKEDIKKILSKKLVTLLSGGDETGLFSYINEMIMTKDKIELFSMFNFIPLLKIQHVDKTINIKLFNFIPLLKIRKKLKGIYYRLFFIIPVLKKTIT